MAAIRRVNPARATLALTAALAVAGTAVAVEGERGPVLPLAAHGWGYAAVLAIVFFGAELVLLNVEFRRQAHSLTLAGIPLVLAILTAPGPALVPVRVAGAAVALLCQRISWDKMAYNLAAYAFEIGLSGAAIRAVLGNRTHLDMASFGVVVGIVLVVDQLMSCSVLLVIGLHNGRPSAADALEVLVPALVLSVVASALATAGVVLTDLGGPLGLLLLAVIVVVSGMAYRGYALTSRRHQSLEQVHEFLSGGVGVESVALLTQESLEQIRSLTHSGTASLYLFDADADADSDSGSAECYQVGEDGAVDAGRLDGAGSDWAMERVRRTQSSVLAMRDTKDPAVRSWLVGRGLRDAIVVALPAAHRIPGAVMVADRLGDTATFDHDDVVMLETLAGHLAVALHNTRLVEKLSHEASHDSLTGLFNRAHVTQRIHETVHGSRPAAVLLLDLDGFKEVNDTLGHDMGDFLLTVVAGRLTETVDPGATVARLGGDEFAILLPNLAGGETAAVALARSVSDSLLRPVAVEEARLDVRASIGVALFSPDQPGADLLRQADTAMYAAKVARSSVELYDRDMDDARSRRSELLADLRDALREDPAQFVLHYQPKMDLASGQVVSVEALVRWQHPKLGFIQPDLFIPLAETTGLIDELTPLVIDAALAQSARWKVAGRDITVAVNLSPHNVGDNGLPDAVAAALDKHQVAPSSLILEITETSVMGDPEQTMPVLHRLDELGVALSLDDFGTGYSSLSYLQRMPVREVKIDRSFVVGLTTADRVQSRALIRAITGLSQTLGLRVVAEGVEDEARLAELYELGCDLAQGYHISRPVTADALDTWLLRDTTHFVRHLRLLSTGA